MAAHFRVLVLDNRGVGRSVDSRPAHSTQVLADDVAAVMDAAGFDRAHYFGLSLAGMFGQWLGIRHPHKIKSLALGCTTALGRRGAPMKVKLQLVRCARLPLEQALDVTARITLNPKFVERRPDILDTWRRIAVAEPPSPWGVVGQGFSGVTHDARRSLRLIQAPTLLITGDRDRLIPARNSYDLLAEIPNAQLHILPGAGHDFPTEAPEATAEALTAFFQACEL